MDQEKTERIWQLLARRMANEITEEETEDLELLLQENAEASYVRYLLDRDWKNSFRSQKEEYLELLLLKHRERLNTVTPDIPGTENERYEQYLPGERKVYRRFWGYVVAAAGVLLIMFATWKRHFDTEEIPLDSLAQHLETKIGSRSEIILSDGTRVRLNAGSSLDYPEQFKGETREVELLGEAYFDVVREEGKPFLVHTRAFTVKVLGTEFNIRAYADEDSAVASLISGAVEVHLKKGTDKVIKLLPNEKLTIAIPEENSAGPDGEATRNPDKIEKVDIKRSPVTTLEDSTIVETAWIDNKLVFKNSEFQNITTVLEKWFGVRILFKSENKKKIKLSGTFVGESLEEILHAFQLTGSRFQYDRDEHGVIWIE